MCAVSMIMDHYDEKWRQRRYGIGAGDPLTTTTPFISPFTDHRPSLPAPTITPAEIEELRKLLDRAREYDKRNNEPDCELDSKRRKLMELAKELGAEISFL